jgi:hypothetical protein
MWTGLIALSTKRERNEYSLARALMLGGREGVGAS